MLGNFNYILGGFNPIDSQNKDATIFDGKNPWDYHGLPSLKLTASLPLKMDGWKTIVSFWDGLFSGAKC